MTTPLSSYKKIHHFIIRNKRGIQMCAKSAAPVHACPRGESGSLYTDCIADGIAGPIESVVLMRRDMSVDVSVEHLNVSVAFSASVVGFFVHFLHKSC